MSGHRMTPERLTEIKALELPNCNCAVCELVAELNAVTRERDDFRAEMVKLATELGTALRERDDWIRRYDMSASVVRDLRTRLNEIIERPARAGLIARRALDGDSAATNEARKPEVCPKCHGSGLLPIPGQKIRCDHVVNHA